MYVVWHRSDGLVSSSKTTAQQWNSTVAGPLTFAIIGQFDDNDWASARALIAETRLQIPCPYCKTLHWADNCPTNGGEGAA
jgi:hypothetical protein